MLLYRRLCQYTAISWDIVYRHWIGFNYIKYWRGGSRPEHGSTLQIRPYTGEHCVNCCPQLSTPCLEPIQAVWRGCLWHKLFLIFPYIDSANMASSRAPKQWCLTKTETANSIEVWRENLIFILNEDARFAPFLRPGVTWKKTSRSSANRGLSNDGDTVPEGERLTAAQKVVILDRMLGQIANYCPIISRNSIVKNSISLDSIWQAIRLHFGLQHTGAQFLDFADIRQEPGEKPEDLYQRLVAFIDDNLLVQGCGITHHGDTVTEDEEVTPSVENFIVLT